MHITAWGGVEVEVGEECRSLAALKEVQRGHNRSFQPRL